MLCNVLFSLFCSVFRGICYSKFVDPHHILFEGDELYKILKYQYYLNVDQLPHQVKVFHKPVNLEETLQENLHDNIAVYGSSFLNDSFANANVNTSTDCILF